MFPFIYFRPVDIGWAAHVSAPPPAKGWRFGVPEIARFYGIIITLKYRDHVPPHIHAEYGGQEATFNINTLSLHKGNLPNRAQVLVLDWMAIHQQALIQMWDTGVVYKLPPLV